MLAAASVGVSSYYEVGWSPDTAALQLFAHLDGEALQVALLLRDKIRERWKDLVDKLSAYYKTPGRLTVFRWKFENAHRHPGLDYLRRHLDRATPETSIVDIVDSCRIWESHAELVAINNWYQDTVYRKPKLLMPPPATDSSVFTVESVMPTSAESPRRGSHSSADRELLIQNVLEAMGTRRCNRLRCPLARMSGLQCFNMGHNGHGINLYGVSMTLMGN